MNCLRERPRIAHVELAGNRRAVEADHCRSLLRALCGPFVSDGRSVCAERQRSCDVDRAFRRLYVGSSVRHPAAIARADFVFFASHLLAVDENSQFSFVRREGGRWGIHRSQRQLRNEVSLATPADLLRASTPMPQSRLRSTAANPEFEPRSLESSAQEFLFSLHAVTFGKIPSARICSTTRRGSVLLSTR